MRWVPRPYCALLRDARGLHPGGRRARSVGRTGRILPLFGIEPGGAVVDAQIVAGVFAVNLFAGVWGFALGFLLRNPALAVGLFAVRTLLL